MCHIQTQTMSKPEKNTSLKCVTKAEIKISLSQLPLMVDVPQFGNHGLYTAYEKNKNIVGKYSNVF